MYEPVSISKYQTLKLAFKSAFQEKGRFEGTLKEKAQLAQQMRDLFDSPSDEFFLYFEKDEVLGLADDLEKSHLNFSIGQYLSALGTLIKL